MRYVTPLREGGSLPAIVEGDDEGLYVLKFRGAGQGPLALVAELIGGEIGRALGLRVPELVFMDLDEAIGRNEPDPEIRDLLISSAGLNLGLDFLPGATMFDPAAGDRADPATASKAVWFDAFITNIDRTPKNANLLLWRKQLYFIDHGASLFFHHNWQDIERMALKPFPAIKQHILLPWADQIADVDGELRGRLSERVVEHIVQTVPDAWLSNTEGPSKEGYLAYFKERLQNSRFVEEAVRARAELV
ncbi:MAG TPA: HipA family kinase [Bryobacteraceae bacterium]|nr:HipA family kinase [Bryobacteraceae bacterium]